MNCSINVYIDFNKDNSDTLYELVRQNGHFIFFPNLF